MKALAIILRVLGWLWLVAAATLIGIGLIGVAMRSGLSGLQEVLSPWNIANWLLTAAVIAPGIGLLILADRLKRKE